MSVATIGFFDGVHRGHQSLIRQLLAEARRLGQSAMLVTFGQPPRAVFAPGTCPPLLTTHEEKLALLRAEGVDDIHVLDFTREMAALTARQFMERVLLHQLHVGTLLVGYDHRFGCPREPRETIDDYVAYGRELGIRVVQAEELSSEEHVSSSAIRRALAQGDVDVAARLLGRNYTWTGRVVHGHAIGRRLGFPTANLSALVADKMLPARGAYAVWVRMSSDTVSRPAMLNIGTRPTIAGGDDVSIEAHLLDYEGDLYGQTLTLEFVARLREECQFASSDELASQLMHDREATLALLDGANPLNESSLKPTI